MINLEDILKNKEGLAHEGKDINIKSIYIEENGKLTHHIFKESGLNNLRSCSKPVVAMAVGIAINLGLEIEGNPITLQTKIYPIIKGLVDINNKENQSKIERWTIKDLLLHTTGYEEQMMSERFIEDIEKEQILEYALNYNIPHEVGVRFAYNNVEPYLLSVIFKEGLKIGLDQFVNKYIFSPLSISEYEWGNHGKYCMAATGLHLRHEDFHKIGQLLLHNGTYKGVEIVPKDWVNDMLTSHIATPDYYKPERLLPKIGAGYFVSVSRDGYVFKDGAEGQYLIINQERNILITIISAEPEMKYVTEILRGII